MSRSYERRWRHCINLFVALGKSVVAQEVLRLFTLIVGMCIVVSVVVQFAFRGRSGDAGFLSGLWQLLQNVHLNRNGIPFCNFFFHDALETAKLAGWALVMLMVFSSAIGTMLAYYRQSQLLKIIVLGLSAVPSFIWPFVIYLLLPGKPFFGFQSNTFALWPAMALAIGDLNLVTVSNAYAESLRDELSRPHVRTVHALRTFAWIDLLPRAMVSLVGAIAARIPHLLGGTVALEVLYNIHGIGFLAWKSIMDVPADYNALIWVCGLGLIVTCAINGLQRWMTCKLLPETLHQPRNDAISDGERPAGKLTLVEQRHEAGTNPANDSRPVKISPLMPRFSQDASMLPHRIMLTTWLSRIAYYLRLSAANAWKLLLASLMWMAFLAFVGILLFRDVRPLNPAGGQVQFVQPNIVVPLGTNAAGDDVMEALSRGLRQQAMPLVIAVVIACGIAIVGALASAADVLSASTAGRRTAQCLCFFFDSLSGFVEAFPKIIVLLACVSFFPTPTLLWKLYLAIGFLFAPQVYRALRDELMVFKRNQFVEVLFVGGVSRRRILLQNFLRNHCLHTLAVQAAVLFGCIILVDSMLGFLGIRNRGEIFTWGSVLGTGTDEFMQFRPVQTINDAVVWGPGIAVWLMIVTMFTLADAMKVPFGGYVYRLK